MVINDRVWEDNLLGAEVVIGCKSEWGADHPTNLLNFGKLVEEN